MPDEIEPLETEAVLETLDTALAHQYRSALQYSIVASSLTGLEAQALGSKLTEFGDSELADLRRLVEKIVSFGGEPTTDVAELHFEASVKGALGWLAKCEEAAVEALQEAIEPTGRDGRSEALEHLMEHLILRKQTQVDFLNRAIA